MGGPWTSRPVTDGAGRSVGSCFVETRTREVSLYGFGWGDDWNGQNKLEFVCASTDSRYRECQLPVNGRASLVKRISDARCIEGQTWGQRRDLVWVDQGCRARFEVLRGGGGGGGLVSVRIREPAVSRMPDRQGLLGQARTRGQQRPLQARFDVGHARWRDLGNQWLPRQNLNEFAALAATARAEAACQAISRRLPRQPVSTRHAGWASRSNSNITHRHARFRAAIAWNSGSAVAAAMRATRKCMYSTGTGRARIDL